MIIDDTDPSYNTIVVLAFDNDLLQFIKLKQYALVKC